MSLSVLCYAATGTTIPLREPPKGSIKSIDLHQEPGENWSGRLPRGRIAAISGFFYNYLPNSSYVWAEGQEIASPEPSLNPDQNPVHHLWGDFARSRCTNRLILSAVIKSKGVSFP